MADEAPETPSPDTTAGPPSTPASPPAGEAPAAADSTTPPPAPAAAAPPSMGAKIGQILHDQAKNADEAALQAPSNLAAGAVQGVEGLVNFTEAVAKHIPLVGQIAAKGLEAVKQNVLPTPEQVTQVYGKPANWMDSMVRGIGNFATLDFLTGGIGGEAKPVLQAGAKVVDIASKVGILGAKATINTAKIATIMTIGSDPRTEDFITQHAKDVPGAGGRFFSSLLALRHNDSDMMAYARSEARNLLSAAAFETAIFGATALAVVRKGGGEAVVNAAKAAHSSLPEPVDAAGMEKLPDGQVKVTDAPPPGSLAETMLPGKPKDLRPLGEKLDNPEGVEDQSRTYEAPPNSGPAPKPPGTDWAGEERRGPARNAFLTDEEAQLARMPAPEAHPDVVMPTEGAANVEVAARNETRSQEDLAQSGPEKYEAGFREIQTAMSKGVHQAVIQQIVRDHDIQVPYGLDGGRLQNYLTKLGELMKSPPDATKPDAQLAREASSLLDPTATPEEMGQRFKDWFQTGDNSDSKIVAAHLYLRTLGSQAAKLGEAFDAAPMSPTAQNNIDKMWDTMMQIYVPMRGEGTRSGRVLRAFGIMKGTIKNALGMGDKEALADAAMDQKAAGFGTEGPAPREAAGPQATEQLAATQSAGKLSPEARAEYARSLRIANGDPAELLEATRQSMIRGELDMKSDVFRAATRAAGMTPGEKAWNAYSTYMINNMISGVGTIEKVAMSQGLMTLKFPIESFLGGTGRVIGGAVRANLDEVKGGAALATQGLNQFMGLATESWSALKAGARAMRAGKSTIDPMMDLFPGGKPTPEFTDLGMGNFLYYPITAPSRLHSSMTEFTKTLVYRSYVRSQALREIAGRNLSPDEISDHVSKALTNAFDPEGKAIQGAQDGALYEARRATMTQPLDNVLMGKGIHDLLSHHPVTRLYMAPFQKIGTNGFKESWSMFPGLAGFQNNVRQQINAGGDASAKAYANMTLGASFLATAFYQAAKGNLTGIGPTNPDLRKQRAALGVHPYTLTLGGVQLNLDRMPIVGPIMAEGADMEHGLENVHARVEARRQWAEDAGENKHVYLANHPIMEALRQAADYVDATRGTLSEDGNAGLEALVASFSKKALDPTWMSGMTKVMDLMTSGDLSHEVGASFYQWISEQLQTAVPWSKFWQSVNNDTIHRETRSVIDELKAKAPGFSKTLEPDYDAFGHVQENTPGFIDWLPNSHVNPMRGIDMKSQAMDTELLAFGKALPGFPKSTAGVDGLPSLDWTDRAKWDQDKGSNGVSPFARVHELLASPMFNGKTAQEVIEEVMGSEAYKKLPQPNPLNTDGPRFKTIAQVMDQLNEAAKAKMLAEPRYANFAKHVLGNQVVKETGKAAADNAVHHAYQHIMQFTGQAPADDTTQTPSFTYIYHGRRK